LTVFSLVVGGLAAALAVMAFTVRSPAAGVVLDVETVTLSTVPTITPGPIPSPAGPPPDAPGADPAPTATSTTLPPEKAPPTELTINDLGISQAVRPVGLDDKGDMEIPEVTEIGWYLHTRRYEQNIVVYAVPIVEATDPLPST
jgi:hypothetical protein